MLNAISAATALELAVAGRPVNALVWILRPFQRMIEQRNTLARRGSENETTCQPGTDGGRQCQEQ